jgi:hypothetical protein
MAGKVGVPGLIVYVLLAEPAAAVPLTLVVEAVTLGLPLTGSEIPLPKPRGGPYR